jgi:hypothetical protein
MRYEGSANFLSGGFNGMNSFYSDIFIAGSGNVSATSGLYIQNSTVTGTGRVLNQYGVIIGDLTAGTVSNRGIACYTYRNFLQGLSIGSDVLDTENPLRVEGNGKFTGTVTASPATLSTALATLGQVTKTQVGLANAENTSDLNKPISTATQTALDTKISGSGTTNQLAKFTGSGAVGPAGITELANGFVGINQPSPTEVIEVVGNVKIAAGNRLMFNSNSFITPENNTSGAEISTAGSFILKTGSTPALALTVNGSQNATFIRTVTAASFNGSASLTGTPTAPTAAAGTNTNQIATTAFVLSNAGVATLPYKVYTALLSQSGSNAPVATVLQNTLGGTVVWSRIGFGGYNGTLSGAFTTNKTTVSISNGWQNGIYYIRAGVASINVIAVSTFQNTSNTDGLLDNSTTSIEIRVYN